MLSNFRCNSLFVLLRKFVWVEMVQKNIKYENHGRIEIIQYPKKKLYIFENEIFVSQFRYYWQPFTTINLVQLTCLLNCL